MIQREEYKISLEVAPELSTDNVPTNGDSDDKSLGDAVLTMGPWERLNYNNATLPASSIMSHRKFNEMVKQYGLNGHMVVVTRSLDDLDKLVKPMRSKHIYHKQIVILCPIGTLGTREAYMDWAEISEYRGVILYQTKDVKPSDEDVINARLGTADCVIVTNSRPLDSAMHNQFHMGDYGNDIDGQNILLVLSLLKQLNNTSTRVSVALKTVHYGQSFELKLHEDVQRWMPSNYLNDSDSITQTWPFMSGMIVLDTLLDHLLAQTFYNPFVQEVVSAFCFEDEGDGSHESSALPCQIQVPEHFLNSFTNPTYGQLFRYMLVRDHLPFGLYRCRVDPSKVTQPKKTKMWSSKLTGVLKDTSRIDLEASRNASMALGDFPNGSLYEGVSQTDWYVVTNPVESTPISKYDLVYVFSRDVQRTYTKFSVPIGRRHTRLPTTGVFHTNVGVKLGFEEGYIDANTALYDHMKEMQSELQTELAEIKDMLRAVLPADTSPSKSRSRKSKGIKMANQEASEVDMGSVVAHLS